MPARARRASASGSRATCAARAAGLLAAALALALCAANPITYQALALGHPEELLGAALCVAAVLLAHARARRLGRRSRSDSRSPTSSGRCWRSARCCSRCPADRWRALIVRRRRRGRARGADVLSSPTRADGTSRLVVSDTGGIFHPWQVFWFLGPRGHWLPAMADRIPRGFRLPPGWLGGRAHLLIVVARPCPLTLFALRRRTRRADALLLLALLMLAALLA